MTNILIIAAEASSELYATRIMEEVKSRGLDYQFFGIGSTELEKQGCHLIERSEKMAVVGLFEVVSNWSVIKKAFMGCLDLVRSKKAPVAVLLDYPGFNLRLAKKLKAMGVQVTYFISPQVWAWKKRRVHLIKKIVDKMLVVFPFEKDFYDQFEVSSVFVGHPLMDELKRRKLDPEKRDLLRKNLGAEKDDFVLGILPGSRMSELKYNLETQLQAAALVASQKPHVKIVVLAAPTIEVDQIREMLPPNFKTPLRIVKEEPFTGLQLMDGCLTASGTATLMAGLVGLPMVIMYKMNAMTAWLARFLVKNKVFGLPNILLKEPVVPELFQWYATPEALAHEVLRFVDDSAYRSQVKTHLQKLPAVLGDGGAISAVVDQITDAVKSMEQSQ